MFVWKRNCRGKCPHDTSLVLSYISFMGWPPLKTKYGCRKTGGWNSFVDSETQSVNFFFLEFLQKLLDISSTKTTKKNKLFFNVATTVGTRSNNNCSTWALHFVYPELSYHISMSIPGRVLLCRIPGSGSWYCNLTVEYTYNMCTWFLEERCELSFRAR